MKRNERNVWGIRLLCGKDAEWNKRMAHGVKAYFTVEAAMVMSLTLSVIVMLVYIMFFQYNRCIMEQDVGTLVLKSLTAQISDKEALMQELKRQEWQLNQERYIAWEREAVVWEVKQNQVKVEQIGRMYFPFAGLCGFNKESQWETIVAYKNRQVSPIRFLRAYNKVMGE